MTERHFILFYEAGPDYLTARAPFRHAHVTLAREAVARGELVLGGAYADAPNGAVLVFKGETAAPAEAFASADPYVRNGVVTRWTIREWTTVVGEGALTRLDF